LNVSQSNVAVTIKRGRLSIQRNSPSINPGGGCPDPEIGKIMSQENALPRQNRRESLPFRVTGLFHTQVVATNVITTERIPIRAVESVT
jgi:hypothetical protein